MVEVWQHERALPAALEIEEDMTSSMSDAKVLAIVRARGEVDEILTLRDGRDSGWHVRGSGVQLSFDEGSLFSMSVWTDF